MYVPLQVFDTKETTMLYPVNSLRNYARMQVPTLSCIRGCAMQSLILVCHYQSCI
jgi:hypothetical protein